MAWFEAAGRIVDEIGAPGFPGAVADGLRAIAPYDFTVVFGYVGSSRPLDLFDDFPEDRRRLHVEEYQEGPYLLDPFFLASLRQHTPGLWRLSELAPDRFYQGEYYRSYYAQTGLAEEIAFLIAIDERLRVVLSMMRRERRFSKAEFRALQAVWPVIDAACRKHWQDVALDEPATDIEIEGRIEAAFQSIGMGVLTSRERQVVELTLRGHSAEAIGGLLGISPGTVRIHRRNIYSKLRISSQGELFSEFISAMVAGRADEGPGRHTFAASDAQGPR